MIGYVERPFSYELFEKCENDITLNNCIVRNFLHESDHCWPWQRQLHLQCIKKLETKLTIEYFYRLRHIDCALAALNA